MIQVLTMQSTSPCPHRHAGQSPRALVCGKDRRTLQATVTYALLRYPPLSPPSPPPAETLHGAGGCCRSADRRRRAVAASVQVTMTRQQRLRVAQVLRLRATRYPPTNAQLTCFEVALLLQECTMTDLTWLRHGLLTPSHAPPALEQDTRLSNYVFLAPCELDGENLQSTAIR